tara:strand:+ start:1405 stop:1668 length:264 start_codon:yes stop_codon:yes gene_type:complete
MIKPTNTMQHKKSQKLDDNHAQQCIKHINSTKSVPVLKKITTRTTKTNDMDRNNNKHTTTTTNNNTTNNNQQQPKNHHQQQQHLHNK